MTTIVLDVIATCLAWNIYFEGRSEPYQGQMAIAEVTITRADLSGRNICEEVFLDKQFSWNNGGEAAVKLVINNHKAWVAASTWARLALENPTNFSKGATHYHADYIKKPRWAYKLCETVRIGRHIFYKACSNERD